MEVCFTKTGGGRTCSWVALRPPRTVVPGPTMAAGGDVPHDLATFMIEESLGIEHGFWGCVAAGATFKSLGRKRTERGRAVIERHLVELQLAEDRVNELYFAWRGGVQTPVDQILNRTKAEWRGLPEGGTLGRHWAAGPNRRRPRNESRRERAADSAAFSR